MSYSSCCAHLRDFQPSLLGLPIRIEMVDVLAVDVLTLDLVTTGHRQQSQRVEHAQHDARYPEHRVDRRVIYDAKSGGECKYQSCPHQRSEYDCHEDVPLEHGFDPRVELTVHDYLPLPRGIRRNFHRHRKMPEDG